MGNSRHNGDVRVALYVPTNGSGIFFKPLDEDVPQNIHSYNSAKTICGNRIPSSAQVVSLCNSLLGKPNNSSEEISNTRRLLTAPGVYAWLFTINLWTPEGVYVVDDSVLTKDKVVNLDRTELENRLSGGEIFKGVIFSQDGVVRFAPKESYNLGYVAQESIGSNGFITATLYQSPQSLHLFGQEDEIVELAKRLNSQSLRIEGINPQTDYRVGFSAITCADSHVTLSGFGINTSNRRVSHPEQFSYIGGPSTEDSCIALELLK